MERGRGGSVGGKPTPATPRARRAPPGVCRAAGQGRRRRARSLPGKQRAHRSRRLPPGPRASPWGGGGRGGGGSRRPPTPPGPRRCRRGRGGWGGGISRTVPLPRAERAAGRCFSAGKEREAARELRGRGAARRGDPVGGNTRQP